VIYVTARQQPLVYRQEFRQFTRCIPVRSTFHIAVAVMCIVAADTLNGGLGNDTVLGGLGTDLIVQGAADGRDIIDGGAGVDTYRLLGTAEAETFRIMTRAEAVLAGITGLAGATEIVITRNGTDNASVIAERVLCLAQPAAERPRAER